MLKLNKNYLPLKKENLTIEDNLTAEKLKELVWETNVSPRPSLWNRYIKQISTSICYSDDKERNEIEINQQGIFHYSNIVLAPKKAKSNIVLEYAWDRNRFKDNTAYRYNYDKFARYSNGGFLANLVGNNGGKYEDYQPKDYIGLPSFNVVGSDHYPKPWVQSEPDQTGAVTIKYTGLNLADYFQQHPRFYTSPKIERNNWLSFINDYGQVAFNYYYIGKEGKAIYHPGQVFLNSPYRFREPDTDYSLIDRPLLKLENVDEDLDLFNKAGLRNKAIVRINFDVDNATFLYGDYTFDFEHMTAISHHDRPWPIMSKSSMFDVKSADGRIERYFQEYTVPHQLYKDRDSLSDKRFNIESSSLFNRSNFNYNVGWFDQLGDEPSKHHLPSVSIQNPPNNVITRRSVVTPYYGSVSLDIARNHQTILGHIDAVLSNRQYGYTNRYERNFRYHQNGFQFNTFNRDSSHVSRLNRGKRWNKINLIALPTYQLKNKNEPKVWIDKYNRPDEQIQDEYISKGTAFPILIDEKFDMSTKDRNNYYPFRMETNVDHMDALPFYQNYVEEYLQHWSRFNEIPLYTVNNGNQSINYIAYPNHRYGALRVRREFNYSCMGNHGITIYQDDFIYHETVLPLHFNGEVPYPVKGQYNDHRRIGNSYWSRYYDIYHGREEAEKSSIRDMEEMIIGEYIIPYFIVPLVHDNKHSVIQNFIVTEGKVLIGFNLERNGKYHLHYIADKGFKFYEIEHPFSHQKVLAVKISDVENRVKIHEMMPINPEETLMKEDWIKGGYWNRCIIGKEFETLKRYCLPLRSRKPDNSIIRYDSTVYRFSLDYLDVYNIFECSAETMYWRPGQEIFIEQRYGRVIISDNYLVVEANDKYASMMKENILPIPISVNDWAINSSDESESKRNTSVFMNDPATYEQAPYVKIGNQPRDRENRVIPTEWLTKRSDAFFIENPMVQSNNYENSNNLIKKVVRNQSAKMRLLDHPRMVFGYIENGVKHLNPTFNISL